MRDYKVETLHAHRPLDWYTAELNRAKFRILRTPEPMLPKRVQLATGVSWRYPHFLFFVAEAIGGALSE